MTLTVKEKIERDSQRALAHAIGLHGSSDVQSAVQDTITDALHALEVIAQQDPIDDTDPRRLALRVAESAVANYLAEAHAVRQEPNETEDILGGYRNPNVHITQADDGEPLYDGDERDLSEASQGAACLNCNAPIILLDGVWLHQAHVPHADCLDERGPIGDRTARRF